MVMCENKMPANTSIPDETHDWTALLVEECVVGSWALAKIKKTRHKKHKQGSGASAD